MVHCIFFYTTGARVLDIALKDQIMSLKDQMGLVLKRCEIKESQRVLTRVSSWTSYHDH